MKFPVLADHITALLSMKGMLESRLGVPIRGCYVSLRSKCHPLIMEYNFLVSRRSPEDLPYILYAEKERRSLHRTFGHSSVRALERSLERASKTNGDTRRLDLL